MVIERGPHGQIQIYNINDNDELILHALDVLQNQLCPLFPKVYIREQLDKKQLCLDRTGLVPLSDFTPSEAQWDCAHVRRVCKEMLISLLDALDYCLPLSCCKISLDNIWINPETGGVYFSYLPVLSNDQIYDCRLSSLNLSDFESFLLHPLIISHIDEVTRHSIVHALQNDDEMSLRQIANAITQNALDENNSESKKSLLLISLVLLLVSVMVLSLSLLFEIISERTQLSLLITGATLMFFLVVLFILVLYCEYSKLSRTNNNATQTTSGAQILFSPFSAPILNYAQNCFEKKLFPAFLTEQGEYGSNPSKNLVKRAIWTNDFLIGSNKYICDLYLNDSCVDEMHARIIRRENNFYLLDLGSKEGSWISHRKLYSHEETLLCHNDLIRVGNRYFLFSYQCESRSTSIHYALESAGTSNDGATSPPVSW